MGNLHELVEHNGLGPVEHSDWRRVRTLPRGKRVENKLLMQRL